MTIMDGNGDFAKEFVQRYWNVRAATFDDESHHGIHTDEQHETWVSVLREWTGEPPLRVLDVGCGTGVVSLLLAEIGHDVTGIDVAPRMIELARTKADRADRSVEFHPGDAESLAFPDDTFDLVAARHLLWTLPNPETAIGEWKRVVEPEGRMLLIEGFWNHPESWDEYAEIHDDLPMYDGKPPEEMGEVLVREGLRSVEYEPLMDPVLWGREPRHDYYILAGTVR